MALMVQLHFELVAEQSELGPTQSLVRVTRQVLAGPTDLRPMAKYSWNMGVVLTHSYVHTADQPDCYAYPPVQIPNVYWYPGRRKCLKD